MKPHSATPRLALATLLLLLASLGAASAQDLQSFEKKTTVHTLDNGWTFILVERPVAPVFSFVTLVDVGGAQEVPGITGLAHMFEHMAFKGTPSIGTTDYQAEKKALEELETAYRAYDRARLEGADPGRVAELKAVFEAKQETAAGFVVQNEFGDIIDREGGTGLNAFTNSDSTGYLYNLPANKVELFAFLESERFLHPVFRDFYKERSVVQEERRMRTESQPVGRMIEQLLATAYTAHPYKQPVVGYMSDLQSFTITDAEAFFREHYTPSNMITAIVGDIDADELIPMLEKYFGRIPARPAPGPLRTVEPPQIAEKTLVLVDPAQPFYVEAYHKPAETHPDQPAYDALNDILSNGRTSRMYRTLVRDEKNAVEAQSFAGFPGDKYPNLLLVYAVPARTASNSDVRRSLRRVLEEVQEEPVSADELERFKTRAWADLVRQLRDNQGLALQLAEHQRLYGDWRELFRYLDRLDAVTAEDVQRVARQTFRDANRTVAMIVTEEPEATPETDDAAPMEGGAR
jgi:predicted Zn-dependent peptidase